ncbi:MAG: cbb3-type cytochrome oxidase assembly protein CcoS [Arenimonas sp.]
MNILLVLIPVSLLLLGIAVILLAWAVRSGQYEDIEAAPLDILGDDSAPKKAHDAD